MGEKVQKNGFAASGFLGPRCLYGPVVDELFKLILGVEAHANECEGTGSRTSIMAPALRAINRVIVLVWARPT